MMIEQILKDICLAYQEQFIKNKDGTRYRIIVSPRLFNEVLKLDVNLIQQNKYQELFLMGIPLTKDTQMTGLKWELCVLKNSKKYENRHERRNINIVLVDEMKRSK